jgi:hypothetical protein
MCPDDFLGKPNYEGVYYTVHTTHMTEEKQHRTKSHSSPGPQGQ